MRTHLTDRELNALHDGHVDSAARMPLMQHVAACTLCAGRLADLASLSRAIAAAPLPVMSQIARARVRRNVLALTAERGVIRLAEILSGLAAAVLMGGLVWLSRSSANARVAQPATASLDAAPPWVDAPTTAIPKINNVTNTPAARWYLADTSSHFEEAL